MIAFVEHESRWQVDAVNLSSGTIGLAQVQPRNVTACKRDPEGAECAVHKERLRGWRVNLSTLASYFDTARSFCRARVGSSRESRWLQLPTGWDAKRGSRCGRKGGRWLPVPKGVLVVMKRRDELVRLHWMVR